MRINQCVRHIGVIPTLAVAAFIGCSAGAQDIPAKQTPHDRLMAASASMSLEDAKSRPWHLKVEATVYDNKGQNPQVGTIERWRNGEDQRTVFLFGDAKRTELHSGGKYYGNSSGVMPYFADEVLDRIMHSGPVEDDFYGTNSTLNKETLAKIPFDCIMLVRTGSNLASMPTGLFPTYCLLRDTNDLRISYDFGGEVIIFNRVGKFLDHEVPLTLTFNEGPATVAKANVTSLAVFTPETNEFTSRPDEIEIGNQNIVRISGGVMAGHKLRGPNPVYPADARMRHVSGTVVMRAVIGRDGHIHSLKAMSCPDPYLVMSALSAVRDWSYTPYVLNGAPTDVVTTITVNFNLN
ncbi:MAG TPA: energy transducer TonB [Acidobacteriaceae bacterium]|jgi:TonB family protein